MIKYEKINPPSCSEESTNECFDCRFKYPASEMNGFFCNKCWLFHDKYDISPGSIKIMEINGVKYRVWYVDISADTAKSIIITETKN